MKNISLKLKQITFGIVLAGLPVVSVFADDTSDADFWSKYFGSFPTMDVIVEHLKENLSALVTLLVATSYVMGIWFIFSAINELRLYGQARTMMPVSTNFTGPFSKIVVGVSMMFLPGFLDMLIYNMWGYGADEAGDIGAGLTPALQATALIVRILGYIAMIRGFVILSRAGKQGAPPGSMGKGFAHVIGGILSVNIGGTVDILKALIGF